MFKPIVLQPGEQFVCADPAPTCRLHVGSVARDGRKRLWRVTQVLFVEASLSLGPAHWVCYGVEVDGYEMGEGI